MGETAKDLAERFSRSGKVSERLAAVGILGDLPLDAETEKVLIRLGEDDDSRVASAARNISFRLGVSNPSEAANNGQTMKAIDTSGPLISPHRIRLSLLAQNGRPHVEASPPQADSVRRIVELAVLTNGSATDKAVLVGKLGISERQVDYYLDAARYTGMTELVAYLIAKGEAPVFPILPSAFLAIASQLISTHPVVARLVREGLFGRLDDLRAPADLIQNLSASSGGSALSQETALRRFATAQRWSEWVLDGLRLISEEWDKRLLLSPSDEGLVSPELSSIGEKVGFFYAQKLSDGSPLYWEVLQNRVLFPEIAFSSLKAWDDGAQIAAEIDLDGFREKRRSLDEIGQGHGRTRERVRQIETEVLRSAHGLLEIDQVVECLRNLPTDGEGSLVDISKLTLRSLLRTVELGPLPGHFPDTDDQSSSLGLDAFQIIRSRFSSGMLSPDRVVGTTFAIALSRLGYKPLSWELGLWGKKNPRTRAQLQSLEGAPGFRNRRRTAERVALLTGIFEKEGPLHISRVAKIAEEPNPRVLAAFMTNRAEFELDSLKRTWYISNTRTLNQFDSVFDAMFFIVERDGPSTATHLIREAQKVYPVGNTRLSQSLDDRRLGQLPSGEWDLISRGARRSRGKEPSIPVGLEVAESSAVYFVTVDKNHLRGSGWLFPRWFGWKLELLGTPDSARFEPLVAADGALTVTRRAQQIRAGSVSKPLANRGCVSGCVVKFRFRFDEMIYSADHDCAPEKHLT